MNAKRPKGIRAEGRTKLYVSHLDTEIYFIYPAKGPDTYFNVREQILADNLKTPTMAETASLIYAAWQSPEEKYSKEIIERLKRNWLWTFAGILYGEEGVYIQDNPVVEGNVVVMIESELIKKLEAKDPTVRFVPYGCYKTGEQTPKKLAENPFIQALAKKEGAEKLGEVASKYGANPYVSCFSIVMEDLIRVVSLGTSWNNIRLDIHDLGITNGYAFGIE